MKRISNEFIKIVSTKTDEIFKNLENNAKFIFLKVKVTEAKKRDYKEWK